MHAIRKRVASCPNLFVDVDDGFEPSPPMTRRRIESDSSMSSRGGELEESERAKRHNAASLGIFKEPTHELVSRIHPLARG